MVGEFKYEFRDRQPDSVCLVFTGTIDERTDLNSVFDNLPRNISIDLGGIEHINSVGVREWMRFISKACAEHSVTLQNCSPVMVRQFNMIFNARGNAKIESVILPYYCGECSNEPRVVMMVSGNHRGFAEQIECSQCHSTAEFDDLPESYLSFIDQNETPG